MKTLYLIDGHAHFFRAYHAIRTPMTSPVTGEPTNATFGFVGMLLRLLREKRPDYLAVAIDKSGDRGTFRSEIYADYKANRQAPPEDFAPQVSRCLKLLEELSIPVLALEGYEADDILATVAARFCAAEGEEACRVVIVSKDKDLEQLLKTGRVELLDIYAGQTIDEKHLLETKGLRPDQVADALALMGDTVDNIPGVPGIGPKTAAQLVAQHGTLDDIMAAAADIKGKRGENLRAAAATLSVSRQLVQLCYDCPIELDLASADVRSKINLPRLLPILRELGFNRYLSEVQELLGTAASEPAASQSNRGAKSVAAGGELGLFDHRSDEPHGRGPRTPGHYRAITTKSELDELVAQLRSAEMVAFDTETTDLSPLTADICGISFATEPCKAAYIPIRSPDPTRHLDQATVLAAVKPILQDLDIPKCGHNLKFDMLILRRLGINLRGKLFDSMIASYIMDASRSSHSLDNLALAFLKHTCTPISDLIGPKKRGRPQAQKYFDQIPLTQAAPYAAEDADIALRLYHELTPSLRAMKLLTLLDELEMPLVEVLAELEFNGITVEPAELDRQAEKLQERVSTLERQIQEHAPHPFDPFSPKQLAAVLFNSEINADFPGLGIRPLKRTKTGYSTDAEVLEKLAQDETVASPLPKLIVEHRMLTKLASTYLSALKAAINPATGRVHASFNQTVAVTGRLSSSDPNLQNIPIRTEVGRDIRRAFVAPPGRVLISADYSQIELRLLAHLADDAALRASFERGDDIHRAVAAQIHGIDQAEVTPEQRSGAKMVNFGIVYGITPFGLARRLGIDKTSAAAIIDGYRKQFPGITTFLQECIDQAQRRGYVETIMGRRRPITGIDSRNAARRALAERMAINSVVQGSAADLIKKAMVDIHHDLSADNPRELPPQLRARRQELLMLLHIHDELVFQAPRELAQPAAVWIAEQMEGAIEVSVPLVVDVAIGVNWFKEEARGSENSDAANLFASDDAKVAL